MLLLLSIVILLFSGKGTNYEIPLHCCPLTSLGPNAFKQFHEGHDFSRQMFLAGCIPTLHATVEEKRGVLVE